MQKISIKTVSAQGVETVQTLVRSDGKPVRVIPTPGTKMYVEVDGLLQSVNPKSKSDASKDMQIKQVGKDLILESEGEALVEVVDFYATSGATLNGASWSYAEGGISTQVTVSPESLALNAVGLSGTGAADSSSLVSSPTWLGGLVAGAVGLAAAASGGGSATVVVATNVISGVIVAGPVVGGLKVTVYSASGAELGTALVGLGGAFSVNVGSYTGAMYAKVTDDNGDAANYTSESSGTEVDLGSTLLAVGNAASGATTLNITHLTTIAAQKAGVAADGGSVAGTLTALVVNNANTGTAKAYGLTIDITTEKPVTTLESGTNSYGRVIAGLEGAGANNQATLNTLVAGTTASTTDGTGSLNDATAAKIIAGAAAVQQSQGGAVGAAGLATGVSNLLNAAVATNATSGIVIGAIAGDDVIGAADSGSTVTFTVNKDPSGLTFAIGGTPITPTGQAASGSLWTISFNKAALGAEGGHKLVVTEGPLSASRLYSVADITAPTTGAIALATDAGISPSDGITNVGTVNVSGLEAGATWGYSTTGGTSWTVGTGTSFTLAAGTYTAGAIKVRQTDTAGNVQTTSMGTNAAAITVDTTAPVAPIINAIATDDIIGSTEQGAVITGTNEAGATVALTIGANTRAATVTGTTWSYTLVAADITAMGQGAETISVTQTDAAGNVSPAATRPITVDTVLPSLSTSTLPSTALTNGGDGIGDTVVLTLTFDEVVQGLTTGTNATVFKVAGVGVTANWSGVAGTNTRTLTYTVTTGQTGALTLDEAALKTALAAITDAAGNTFSYTANGGVISNIDVTALPTIDTTVATFTGVTISGVDSSNVPKSGNLSAGDKIKVQLFGSEVLAVTGNPTFSIDVGGVTKQATYYSGSGSSTLIFYYVIDAADVDGSGGITSAAATAVSLAGGTIRDNAGNTADLSTVPSVVSGSNAVTIIVDNVAPVINSIDITSATTKQNNLLNSGDEVMVTVVFSENVIVTGVPQVALTVGATTVQANYVSGSGSSSLVFKYTIVAGNTDTNGIAIPAGALTLNSGTIKDSAGNNATLTGLLAVADNSAYGVDTTAPGFTTTVVAGVDSLNAAKSGTLQVGDKIKVTLSSADALLVSGVPTLAIDVGGVTKQAIYSSGSGTTSLVFYYTVSQGDSDSAGGITVATSAVTIPSGAFITDLAGNGVTTTVAAVAAGANTITVDAVGAPSTSIATLTLSADTGTSQTDFVTKTAAQTISGTLSAGLVSGETVKISFDNGASWSAVSTQPATGAIVFSHTGTISGSNTMLVRVENATKVGASYSHAYTLDTIATSPTFLLQSASDTGLYSNDFVTNQTSLSFDVVGEVGSVVTVFADANSNNVVDAGESLGSTTLSSVVGVVSLASALPVGAYSNMKAIQTDLAGNTSVASAAHSVIKVNTSSAVSIASVASVTQPLYATYQLDMSAGVTAANLIQGTVDAAKTSGYDAVLNDGGGGATSTNSAGDKWNITSYITSTGLTIAQFLSSVKMAQATFAGVSIVGSNTIATDPSYNSYVSLSGISTGSSTWFTVQDGAFLKGTKVTFTVEQINGVDQLMIRNSDDGYLSGYNLYDSSFVNQVKNSNSYSIGNISLYYQKELLGAVITKPSYTVSYDGTSAQIGDQVQIYEGTVYLGNYVLTSADIGAGTKSVTVSVVNSLSAGSHDLSFKYVDLAGNAADFATHQTATIATSSTQPPALLLTGITVNKEGGQLSRTISDFSTYQSTVDPDITFNGNVDQATLINIYANNKLVMSKNVSAGTFNLTLQSYVLAPGVYDFKVEAVNSSTGMANAVQTTKGIGVFAGYSGTDTIVATSNNDNISAGDGINTITTGAGSDVVFIKAIDSGVTTRSVSITDFSYGKDLIDVTGFLGTSVTAATLSNYVSSTVSGGNTVLTFDSNTIATAGGNIHTVTLQGVTGVTIDSNLIRYAVI